MSQPIEIPQKDRVVLCIPGAWASRSEFTRALAESSGGKALFAGLILMDPEAGSCAMYFEDEPDPRIPPAFSIGSVVYLVDAECGTEVVTRMIALSHRVLPAGGLGVKVEAAGKTFFASRWMSFDSVVQQHWQLVLHMVTDDGGFFSCGMHQFGLPDTYVVGDDFDEAVSLANGFEKYQIFEKPELESGHTFSLDDVSPRWRMELCEHPYAGDEYLDRSLGIWRMTKVG